MGPREGIALEYHPQLAVRNHLRSLHAGLDGSGVMCKIVIDIYTVHLAVEFKTPFGRMVGGAGFFDGLHRNAQVRCV